MENKTQKDKPLIYFLSALSFISDMQIFTSNIN